jgi:NAD(P)-dependent dehydrogenase (short-subunit alcohol dehydrogenase family)|tara:strand:+ start:210 stop:1040 length:831 start_codon:yes stop_codon:yes gene_type:complete
MKHANNTSKLFDVKNRNVVITGSSGLLGSQYANTLSEAGANVILVDLESKKNKTLEKSLVKKYRTNARSYTSDISNLQEVKKLAKNVLKDFKRIDGLINNAAFTSKSAKRESDRPYGSFENFPMEIWQKSIDINLTGVFFCSQAFGKIMLRQRKGVIVNIASHYGLVGADQRIYGKSGLNLPISYAATKGAVVNMTRYLAAYWNGKGIRVNTLSPGGVIDTTYQDKKFIKKYSERTILGRMAKRDEYNGAILFLISDASSYMTGANLIVDGGWTAW